MYAARLVILFRVRARARAPALYRALGEFRAYPSLSPPFGT